MPFEGTLVQLLFQPESGFKWDRRGRKELNLEPELDKGSAWLEIVEILDPIGII
jgi:hypothetical protein